MRDYRKRKEGASNVKDSSWLVLIGILAFVGVSMLWVAQQRAS